jgi:hypothetical protein
MATSPLRTLFITEGILKVLGGAIFFFSPSTILQQLQEPPYGLSSLSLVQSLGIQTIAFSIPLFLAARRDEASLKSRKIVYWALLGREGFLALGLLGQIGWNYFVPGWAKSSIEVEYGEARALEEGYGRVNNRREDLALHLKYLRRGLWLWILELVPFVVGRIWVLKWKAHWFR